MRNVGNIAQQEYGNERGTHRREHDDRARVPEYCPRIGTDVASSPVAAVEKQEMKANKDKGRGNEEGK